MGAMKFFHLEIITFFPEIVFNLIICRVIYLVCVERKSSKKAKQHLHPPPPCDDKHYAVVWRCSVEVDELPGADGVSRLKMIILIAIFCRCLGNAVFASRLHALPDQQISSELKTHSKHISLFKFSVLPCRCILFTNYRFSVRSDSSAFGNTKSK